MIRSPLALAVGDHPGRLGRLGFPRSRSCSKVGLADVDQLALPLRLARSRFLRLGGLLLRSLTPLRARSSASPLPASDYPAPARSLSLRVPPPCPGDDLGVAGSEARVLVGLGLLLRFGFDRHVELDRGGVRLGDCWPWRSPPRSRPRSRGSALRASRPRAATPPPRPRRGVAPPDSARSSASRTRWRLAALGLGRAPPGSPRVPVPARRSSPAPRP